MIDATIVECRRPQWLKGDAQSSSNRELEAAAEARVAESDAAQISEPTLPNEPEAACEVTQNQPATAAPEAPVSDKKLAHRDTDARFTKKHGEDFFGYKQHVNVDAGTGFIRQVVVSAANVHDGHVLEQLLEDTVSGRDARLYADSAYRSAENEAMLSARGMKARIQHKRQAGKDLPQRKRAENRRWSRVRARVEHVFAQQCGCKPGGRWLYVTGQVRVATKLKLDALAYNLARLRWHLSQAQESCARRSRKGAKSA